MLKKIIMIVTAIIVLPVVGGALFMLLAPTFGAKPKGTSLEKIQNSSHYRNGNFENLIETRIDTREKGESMDVHMYLFPEKDKNPARPLPSHQFDKTAFKAGDFVWFGHSTVLFRTNTLSILTDPVFNRASPVPIGGKPFEMERTPSVDQLPEIDVVLISHDHYDHLDHKTIGFLAQTTQLFLVPLGNLAHLERWGVSPSKVIELDWYESYTLQGTTFTLTPSRHFSGRGLNNRNSTLWGSWVIKSPEFSVFHSGDTGYFDEFQKIGDRFGPFDIAFIENGAYDKGWAEIHMTPEQSTQTAIDLKAHAFFPIHWGKFDLAKHQWTDPITRAVTASKALDIQLVAPQIGQTFQLSNLPFEPWWQQ